jgi:hypothetical protein
MRSAASPSAWASGEQARVVRDVKAEEAKLGEKL